MTDNFVMSLHINNKYIIAIWKRFWITDADA